MVVPARSIGVMSRRYEDLAGPDIAERILPSSTLLLPIGAVEQHGPHLPLAVDHVIAHETATALVDRVGDELDVWQLPTLSISKSNEHAWSPGTLWYSAETMLAMLRDLGRSIATTGCERLVLLNGHGGNTTLLATALRELRLEFGLKTFLVHPSVPPAYGGASTADELGMGIHGGLHETSVYFHLRPEHVDMSKAERKVPEALDRNEYVKFGGPVMFGWLSNDFDPDGYIGDPTGATAALGAELFEANVDHLARQMAEIATFDFGR